MEYDKDPAPDSPRFTPGGIVLGSANIGDITGFIHYTLGAGGGPSATYLLFFSNYNATCRCLSRVGLYELPLAQSPGERLDDLEQYGYYGAHVGLNNLPLSSPRWGLQADRTFGHLHVYTTASIASFQGAPYGGKPVPTGETSWMRFPELSAWLRDTLFQTNKGELDVGGERSRGNAGNSNDGTRAVRRFIRTLRSAGARELRQFGRAGRAVVRRRPRCRRLFDERALVGRIRPTEILPDSARLFRSALRRLRKSVHQSRLRLLRRRTDRAVPAARPRGAATRATSVLQRCVDSSFPGPVEILAESKFYASLVVEDNAPVAESIRTMLEARKYAANVVSDGTSGARSPLATVLRRRGHRRRARRE